MLQEGGGAALSVAARRHTGLVACCRGAEDLHARADSLAEREVT